MAQALYKLLRLQNAAGVHVVAPRGRCPCSDARVARGIGSPSVTAKWASAGA
jgi:hypothetical protein